MRSKLILTIALVATVLVPVAHAEVQVTFRPGGEPIDLQARQQARQVDTRVAPIPESAVLVPYFEVETGNNNGLTTLFAVRNGQPMERSLGVGYVDEFGNQDLIETLTIGPRQTLTVNVRDKYPPNIGTVIGSIAISSLDDEGMPDLDANNIGGDYFLLDPGNDFASGGALLGEDDFCRTWVSRFFNGGAFSGGTEFIVLVPFNNGATSPQVVGQGQVFNEAGDAFGTVDISTDQIILTFNSLDLAGLPNFGTIEWTFTNVAVLISTFEASGEYSVGVTPQCVDSLP